MPSCACGRGISSGPLGASPVVSAGRKAGERDPAKRAGPGPPVVQGWGLRHRAAVRVPARRELKTSAETPTRDLRAEDRDKPGALIVARRSGPPDPRETAAFFFGTGPHSPELGEPKVANGIACAGAVGR